MFEDMTPGLDKCVFCEIKTCVEDFNERVYNDADHYRYDIYYCSAACMKKSAEKDKKYIELMKSRANAITTESHHFDMCYMNNQNGNYGYYKVDMFDGIPCIVEEIHYDRSNNVVYVRVTKPKFCDGNKYHFEFYNLMDGKLVQFNTTRICVTVENGCLKSMKLEKLVTKKGKVLRVVDTCDSNEKPIMNSLWN